MALFKLRLPTERQIDSGGAEISVLDLATTSEDKATSERKRQQALVAAPRAPRAPESRSLTQ
jgi:hypothetical protein